MSRRAAHREGPRVRGGSERQITADQRAARDKEILELHGAGLSGVEIARRLGCSPPTVSQALRRAGVPRSNGGRPRKSEEGRHRVKRWRAVRWYLEDGLSQREIAARLGVSQATISEWLCQLQVITPLARGGRRRRQRSRCRDSGEVVRFRPPSASAAIEVMERLYRAQTPFRVDDGLICWSETA